jgi:hypothetical protein
VSGGLVSGGLVPAGGSLTGQGGMAAGGSLTGQGGLAAGGSGSLTSHGGGSLSLGCGSLTSQGGLPEGPDSPRAHGGGPAGRAGFRLGADGGWDMAMGASCRKPGPKTHYGQLDHNQ